jgi:hypothetical protein
MTHEITSHPTLEGYEFLKDVPWDGDEGTAEALRRDAEIDANPERAISLAQLGSHIQNRRHV